MIWYLFVSEFCRVFPRLTGLVIPSRDIRKGCPISPFTCSYCVLKVFQLFSKMLFILVLYIVFFAPNLVLLSVTYYSPMIALFSVYKSQMVKMGQSVITFSPNVQGNSHYKYFGPEQDSFT
ncbi:hypothetical protein PanWU01x14_175760 [Parasponia andersonii]|uniref:Transmembrane protein n=1 Tax=Parasponia andersonii TaxID=3476 RepID=A0A2P5C7Y4_PARAD|nr:hypothetical protein PanWU01x14_175760 [Parasponia andersonii]